MTFVVIGGDAAGMSAASRIKRHRSDWDVIVLEQTEDVSYSACGMPYNIADARREMDDLVVRHARVFREKQGIDLRTGHRVNDIDTGAKAVRGRNSKGEDFEIPYDKLLIATGASPAIPDLPGFDLPGVLALKSLEDGRRLKRFIEENSVKKVVIIGMGYIALEMCEALRTRDINVDMVKPGPVLLPWMEQGLAAMVKNELEVNGAGLYMGHEIRSVKRQDDVLRVVCDDMELDADMVLVAIGVRPNSELAQEAGLALGPKHSISVDRFMRTSGEDIYAAGDCADAYHVVSGKKVWIPLALRANRGGWAVADDIAGRSSALDGIAGTAVFKVFDLEVARTGFNMEEALEAGFSPREVSIESSSRAHGHPGSSTMGVSMVGDRQSGRLLGVQIVAREGAAHRVNAPAVALHAAMTVEAFSQSDMAYAPPFSPVWDPMLTAANQLLKKM